MIEIFLNDGSEKELHDKKSALRFMYMMRNNGIWIRGWRCDDPEDNEWLNKRFKQQEVL